MVKVVFEINFEASRTFSDIWNALVNEAQERCLFKKYAAST